MACHTVLSDVLVESRMLIGQKLNYNNQWLQKIKFDWLTVYERRNVSLVCKMYSDRLFPTDDKMSKCRFDLLKGKASASPIN